jgi:hypothetical protein
MIINKWLGNWKAINFVILAGLNALDYLTTKIVLANGGKEANPLMDYLIVSQGIDHLILFKIFALGMILIAIKYMSVRLLMLLNTFYLFVVLWNWTVMSSMGI